MSFSTLAPVYRALESIVFGDALQRARLTHLHAVQEPTRALLAGEGDGRFLLAFIRAFPECEVTCIDGSAGMLKLARERLQGQDARVHFVCADLFAPLELAHKHDLIVTHFLLDCFEGPDLSVVVRKLLEAATTDAQWVITDFAVPPTPWPRFVARWLIGVMYLCFRLTTEIRATQLVDPTPFLIDNGMLLSERKAFLRGIVTADLWQRR